ncbi:hypothetical protein KJA16_01340 [Patescibacteria group bacterium]|nr:hypothetical protein [Patescibacteria group bacterium]
MAEKKPEIEKLDSFISTIVWLVGFAGVICLGGWIFRFFGFAIGVLGVLLFIVAILLSGLKIVQKPEVWIIERFGEYQRKLKPGLRWMIPFIETVRAKPRLWEQPVPIFATQPKIDFRDGSATLKDPKSYVELDEKKIEDAIYEVRNWAKWIEDTIEPIIRGYLNTLSIKEALDEGRARGNLIERLKEAPELTENQLEEIKREIEIFQEEIDKGPKKARARVYRLLKEESEKKKKELEIRLAGHKRLEKEFKDLKREAKKRGIKEIHRVVVAEFGLDESVIKARQRPLEERRRAEAAVFEAMREATLRTESIRRTKERLVETGYPEKDALRKAYELDVLETLATTGSLFLTGEVMGISPTIARIAGIFTEVSKRREKKSKK